MLPQYAKLYSIADAPTNPRPIEHHHVVVCAEENGGSDALLPVVQELRTRNVGVTALLAGEGAKAFQAKGSRYGLGVSEVSPWPPAATRPNALLYSASNDGRLEEYLSATFPDVNSVMIEDHYESSRYAVSRIHRRGLRVPTICGLDTEADRLIKERFKPLFPDLEIP